MRNRFRHQVQCGGATHRFGAKSNGMDAPTLKRHQRAKVEV